MPSRSRQPHHLFGSHSRSRSISPSSSPPFSPSSSDFPHSRRSIAMTPRFLPLRTRTSTSLIFVLLLFIVFCVIGTAATTYIRSTTTSSAPSPHPLIPAWFNPDSLIGGAPRTRSAPDPGIRGFSDQSSYVSLGSHTGAVVAVADFNRDRFLDLLMLDSSTLRTLSVMLWDHDAYSFVHAHPRINLDGSAVRAAEAAAGESVKPLGKVTGVYVADFSNDGALDVLVSDGRQGRLFFGDGNGGFRSELTDTTVNGTQAAASITNISIIVIPELPSVAAVVDADADSVPDLFVIFPNATRGFWQFLPSSGTITNTSASVNDKLRNVAKFREWPGGANSGPDGKPCQTEIEMAGGVSFADMDGDCLADLVIPTTCGLEVWSNGGTIQPFWDMSASRDAKHMRLLDTQVYNYGHGDRAILITDFDSDGTNDIAIVNRNRHDMIVHRNKQMTRAISQLCVRDVNWKLQKVVGMSSSVNLRRTRIGPLLGGGIDITPSLHSGDFNQDGYADVLAIDGSTTKPLLLRNLGGWDDLRPEESHFEVIKDTVKSTMDKSTRGNAVSATFFDTDESGRQDILVVRSGNETRLIWNGVHDRWDALFFKGTMLSGLPFRSDPRPFAPVAGNTIKLSYMRRGSRGARVRRVCSQCAQTGVLFQLQTCNCQYGLNGIANYVEELWAGAAGTSRGWTGLMPNSMAVIWGDASGNAASWWMEYFTQRRGSQMLRVTAILFISLIILAGAIVYLQNREVKEDRERDERESQRLFSFVV